MAVNIKKDYSRSKPKPDITNLVYGKIPPQAPELEKAVLGALMFRSEKIDLVYGILPKAECFYTDQHQRIYAAVLSLYHRSSPIDIEIIGQELLKRNDLELVGGGYYLASLMQDMVSDAHIEAHAKIIMEKYLARELIRIGATIVSTAYENSTDIFDLIDKAQEEVTSVSADTSRASYTHISSDIMETVNDTEEASQNKTYILGISSGFRELDRLTYGWQKGDLNILAARPSVGKTAFGLNLIMNAGFAGQPVAFFSLEMSRKKLIQRCLSAVSEIGLDKIKTGKLEPDEWQKLNNAAERLAKAPIYLDDTGGLNIYELRTKARKMVKSNGVQLIVIDYLQLMQGIDNGKNSNREAEVSKISRDLKSLAKELQISIIALSQLNRAVETRKENKGEPFMADLRESGAIEQDADSVIFLWRPDYQSTSADGVVANDVTLKIGKSRDGKIDKLAFKVDLAIQKFFTLSAWDDYKVPSLFLKPNAVIGPDEDLPF